MPWLVIQGAKPYDGRYELDLAATDFTTREWGWLKRLAGYLPLNIEEGFAGGDPELFAVFAAIALHRAGKVDRREVPDVFERFGDAPFGTTIRLEPDDQPAAEDDADPPPASSNANGSSSGDASTTSSETSPTTPEGSGTPASDSSASTPIRLAT